MSLPRIRLERTPDKDERLLVRDDEYRYLARSRRLAPGDSVEILTAEGMICTSTVESITDKLLILAVGEIRENIKPVRKIGFILPIIKHKSMDFVVQKCSELGIDYLQPVLADRCVPRIDRDSVSSKISRWEKLSEESTKQSGRAIPMKIYPITSLKLALASHSSDKSLVWAAAPGEAQCEPLPKVMNCISDDFAILVGPEGGWSDGEIKILSEMKNAISVSMGIYILRVETAAIAMASYFSIALYASGCVG